ACEYRALAAHPSPTPSACASRCNKTNRKPAFCVDAARRRLAHDPDTHAGVFQSVVQRKGSAMATAVLRVGHESPSLEFAAGRPPGRGGLCRPQSWGPPSPPELPLVSVPPAPLPMGCEPMHPIYALVNVTIPKPKSYY